MSIHRKELALVPAGLLLLASCVFAQSAEIKAKVEAKAKQLAALGSDPTVVAAVRAYNAAIPPDAAAMTSEKWKGLTQLDPSVRAYTRNALAAYLKGRMDPAFSEWFVSAAGGSKVAFAAKPSNWSHAGKEKHQVPMTGRVYIGAPELDESTGQKQIQIGVPVLDGGRPIGSIVAGIAVSKL